MGHRVSSSEWSALKANVRRRRATLESRSPVRDAAEGPLLTFEARRNRGTGITLEDRLAVEMHELLKKRNRPIGV